MRPNCLRHGFFLPSLFDSFALFHLLYYVLYINVYLSLWAKSIWAVGFSVSTIIRKFALLTQNDPNKRRVCVFECGYTQRETPMRTIVMCACLLSYCVYVCVSVCARVNKDY